MSGIAEEIMWKYPNATPRVDFDVRDNGDGVQSITYWNVKDPTGVVVPEPTQSDLDSWSLGVAKQTRLAYLAQCRDNAIFGTFQSSCTSTLYTYTADDRARLRYERCARKAATDNTYTGDSIYTHEAGFVAHTGAQLIKLCEDGAAHERDQWSRYQTDATNVQNATTVDAVNAVTW